MTVSILKLAGNFLYFIGMLILVPAGVIIVTSINTLMLAGPIALLIPVLGAILGGAGKWLKHKARQLEEEPTIT
jgi:hypothetical protein